jgi:hypothetical protein
VAEALTADEVVTAAGVEEVVGALGGLDCGILFKILLYGESGYAIMFDVLSRPDPSSPPSTSATVRIIL